MDVLRTPDERFADLAHWPYSPTYVEVLGLRMHVVDEGPPDGPVMLLLHGEPSWSYLYRHWIPVLVDAGYRAVAVDAVGFGRSDKVTDVDWYSLDRHVAQLQGVIEQLDLRDVTVCVQDWAGPIGLVTALEAPERFARLVIMNTWLHHDGYEYTEGLHRWHEMAKQPDLPFGSIVAFSSGASSQDPAEVLEAGYQAPFPTRDHMAGAVAWPAMLPFAQPERGGAARQARAWDAIQRWDRPAHLFFGDQDPVFTVDWGRRFAAAIPGATFEVVEGAHHFVQEVGAPLARRVLAAIAAEG
ncbi:MAG TPA: haloalkane dehalogenase [Acidimicrobiales bacterium]|nr:haloalkane dehalogenase [Acidimicrobiales bacterium]